MEVELGFSKGGELRKGSREGGKGEGTARVGRVSVRIGGVLGNQRGIYK